jgi:asparagine synthase (glutamine-hydrolysing)
MLPRSIRRGAADAGTAILPVGFKGRNWLSALGADFRREVPPVQWLFDSRSRGRLMATHPLARVAESVHTARTPVHGDLLQRATRMDFENYLAEDILVKVDRASMLASLEVRAPFLDYRIVEFAFSKVRSDRKAAPNGLKLLLKSLCERVLPRGFDHQRKQGFSIPLAHWLQKGPWATMLSDVLLSGDTIFDRKTVRSLLDGQRRGLDNSERLFALTLFELWRREYAVTL